MRADRRPRTVWFVLLSAVVALAGCTSETGSGADSGASAQAADLPDLADCPVATAEPATGAQTLPALTLPCLDSGGGELALGEAPGVPLVVNLWATWCGPCRDELPLFSQLYGATDRDELLVTGVVTRDGAGPAAEFAVDLGIEFPSGFDDNGDVYADQGLRGLPATFFVNADGSIAHAELAVIESYDDLVALVGEYLGVTV